MRSQVNQVKSCLVKSPLNYTGGKFRLLNQIVPLFPQDIISFVDLFCGGGNVGINVAAKKVLLNDKSSYIQGILGVFKKYKPDYIIRFLTHIIKLFGLSESSVYGLAPYKYANEDGLQRYNKPGFMRLRETVNAKKVRDDSYYLMLYLLTVYSFNNQIRFNKRGEFNVPVGKRDFNIKMQSKLTIFSEKLNSGAYEFSSLDFRNVSIDTLAKDAFVYADPPYIISCATYNESKEWTQQDEIELFHYLDELNHKGIRFALSNIIADKGRTNVLLGEWLAKRDYKQVRLEHSYRNSNYHKRDKLSQTKEVLVFNY